MLLGMVLCTSVGHSVPTQLTLPPWDFELLSISSCVLSAQHPCLSFLIVCLCFCLHLKWPYYPSWYLYHFSLFSCLFLQYRGLLLFFSTFLFVLCINFFHLSVTENLSLSASCFQLPQQLTLSLYVCSVCYMSVWDSVCLVKNPEGVSSQPSILNCLSVCLSGPHAHWPQLFTLVGQLTLLESLKGKRL